jgi:hypothetical protein
MTKFNLKEAISKNSATFFSSVNESQTPTKPKSPEQLIYKLISKNPRFKWLRDDLPTDFTFEDIKNTLSKNGYAKEYDYFMGVDENEINEETKPSKMKKSELKTRIKEMVLAEMNLDVDDTTDEYDFLSEKKEDEEDTEVEDTEVDVDGMEDIDVDTTGEVDPNVKAVQDLLTQAQAAAQSLGDEKLTDQIGNTITFFTRAHVVDRGAVAENEEIEETNEAKLTIPELGQLKIGDKVKYLGKDMNGFTNGGQYEVSRKESSSTFQPTITIKNNDGKKLRTSNISLDNEDMNESMFPMLKKIM